MSPRLHIALVAAALLVGGVGPALADDDELLLRTRPGALAAVLDRHALELEESLSTPSGPLHLVEIECEGEDDDAEACELELVLAALAADPDVESVETDDEILVSEALQESSLNQSTAAILGQLPDKTPLSYFGTSVWAGFADQAAADLIEVDDARRLGLTGSDVVAVIDTGVDPEHPLLGGALLPGFDYTNPAGGNGSEMADVSQSTAAILEGSSAALADAQAHVNQSTAAILEQSTAAILEGQSLPAAFGHGTMVAGLIRLVAPTAFILPLKAFRADGTSDTFTIVRAVYAAVEQNVKVINMSFSLTVDSGELRRAVDYATASGVVCVASAGNAAEETLVYPAAYANVIGVGATSNMDLRSSFTNYGPSLVTLAAPGEVLITAYPGGQYAAVWGTSFSTALVTGGVALLAQQQPGLDQTAAEQALSRAEPIGDPGLGAGRLDLERALVP